MSSERKQDVVTKTVEDERIQIGVLRPSVDEAEEPDEEEEETEESKANDDSSKSTSLTHCQTRAFSSQ